MQASPTLVAILALAAAACYGVSDFAAGLASRRVPAAIVGFAVQCAGVLLAGAFAIASGATATPEAVSWGAVASLGSGVGTLALYRGLGRARMSVVAPLAAVTSAALPVTIGVALGDQPGSLAWIGIALAIPATAFVSAVGDDGSDRPAGIPDGLLAGVGFTVLYLGLHRAGDSSGSWPVVVQLIGAGVVLAPFAFVASRRARLDRAALGQSILAGLLAAAAACLFVVASGGGLAVAAVVTSLFPAFTVLLAWAVLRERIRPIQCVGLMLAAASVMLIAM